MINTFCIVEDDPLDYELNQEAILEAFPKAVLLWAKTVKDVEAIVADPDVSVDVFVIDYGLPDGTGFDAADKTNPDRSLVILNTGMNIDYMKTFRKHIDGYSPKPLTAGGLTSILKGARWLGKTKD